MNINQYSQPILYLKGARKTLIRILVIITSSPENFPRVRGRNELHTTNKVDTDPSRSDDHTLDMH